MKNWKTSAAGIGTLLVAVGSLAIKLGSGEYIGAISFLPEVMGAIAGLGFFAAKDAPDKEQQKQEQDEINTREEIKRQQRAMNAADPSLKAIQVDGYWGIESASRYEILKSKGHRLR